MRLGHADPGAVLGVTADADQDQAVFLHVNSGGNALACKSALTRDGYRCEDVPAVPGQYGVRLRVLTAAPDITEEGRR